MKSGSSSYTYLTANEEEKTDDVSPRLAMDRPLAHFALVNRAEWLRRSSAT
jgi:hypothetical protein